MFADFAGQRLQNRTRGAGLLGGTKIALTGFAVFPVVFAVI